MIEGEILYKVHISTISRNKVPETGAQDPALNFGLLTYRLFIRELGSYCGLRATIFFPWLFHILLRSSVRLHGSGSRELKPKMVSSQPLFETKS